MINFEVNDREQLSVFKQIQKGVMQNIADGHIKTGDILPSVRDLASMLNVNPNTVAKSYKELVTRKIVDSKRGRGYFVTSDAFTNISESISHLTSDIPIYQKIQDEIIEKITSGELKTNDALPSVRKAADDYDVNPNTIAKSYRYLELKGYVYSRRGVGCFVREQSDNNAVNPVPNSVSEVAHTEPTVEDSQKHAENSTEVIEATLKKPSGIDQDNEDSNELALPDKVTDATSLDQFENATELESSSQVEDIQGIHMPPAESIVDTGQTRQGSEQTFEPTRNEIGGSTKSLKGKQLVKKLHYGAEKIRARYGKAEHIDEKLELSEIYALLDELLELLQADDKED